jgi:hypothetical protein
MYGKVIGEYYPKAGVVLFVLYITHSTVEQTRLHTSPYAYHCPGGTKHIQD